MLAHLEEGVFLERNFQVAPEGNAPLNCAPNSFYCHSSQHCLCGHGALDVALVPYRMETMVLVVHLVVEGVEGNLNFLSPRIHCVLGEDKGGTEVV